MLLFSVNVLYDIDYQDNTSSVLQMTSQLETNLRTAEHEILNMITAFGLKHSVVHDIEKNIKDQISNLYFKVLDPTPNQQTALRRLGNRFDAEWHCDGKVPESQRIRTVSIEVDFTPASPKIIRDEKARIAEMKIAIQSRLDEFGINGKFEESLSFACGIGSSTVVCHVWDASPEQAEILRKMASDYSYGRSEEKLPANEMQIYQFSIVNKYTYPLMDKAWMVLKDSDAQYTDYPNAWSDVEKYVEGTTIVAISEMMGLHQKCKNILSTHIELFKVVTAKVVKSAPRLKVKPLNDQISLF